ncbi:MAG: NADH-quinone oxidoreductase subunit N [Candidatus Omnitrophota bacterium]|nr:NADH-quinone oxidoreductase subunit N [Candidatus Omnitrophota bacterium]
MSAIDSIPFFIPEILLLIGAFAVLFADFFVTNKKLIGITGLVILVATACLARLPAEPQALFSGFFQLDAFTHFFRYAALGIVGVTILTSLSYARMPKAYQSEYYSLFLFMAFGLILMSAATNLLMIFLAVEFVSIVSYLLVGFLKDDPGSKEASAKYLLFGSLASAIMLFGMSLLFGATGSLDLDVIRAQLAGSGFADLGLISLMLILVGLGFKISMAPFHMWAPDVYQGAPTPVTAFLTVGPKALGFAVLIRVLAGSFDHLYSHWSSLIFVLSILTMTIGNVVAIAQNNIKRLLAYSSIAQAGYILMGIVAFSDTGLRAVLIYLIAYAFTNLGAFVVVIAVSNRFQSDELESYSGLGRRAPLLAASLTIFLLSLAGMPPFAGFIGKFYVFTSALEAGFVSIAVVAALNSAVAAYYYFRVIRQMYLVPASDEDPISPSFSLALALCLMLIGTIALGIFPGPLLGFISQIVPL